MYVRVTPGTVVRSALQRLTNATQTHAQMATVPICNFISGSTGLYAAPWRVVHCVSLQCSGSTWTETTTLVCIATPLRAPVVEPPLTSATRVVRHGAGTTART